MPNTYTKIYIHAITVVKCQQALIQPDFKIELYKYMAGIIKEAGHLPIMINGVTDHVHLFICN